MASTKIPAITDYLLTLWESTPDLTGVEITEAEASDSAKEWVVVLGAKSTRDWRSLGNSPTPLTENFSITCDAACIALGKKTYAEAKTRAYELLLAAESAVRDDVHLGGLVQHCKVSSAEHRFQPVDKGKACAVRFVIEGKTRI